MTRPTAKNGVTTRTPYQVQTGMESSCDKFHLAVSRDGYSTIASNAGISLTNFYSWNPAGGLLAPVWTWVTTFALAYCHEGEVIRGCDIGVT
ncbi:hypothetical protein F5Y16DRAFT_403722 [Xylariaceae sp. FL0255]|nr:hypothetical protein F5Y16DRAFT_403722 [Xylariaceae sp. FL0255]